MCTPDHVQIVQRREDETNEAIMAMEANIDVLISLRDFYKRLMENNDFDLKTKSQNDVITLTIQVDDLIYGSKMQISSAKTLVKLMHGRKSLVRISLPYSLYFFAY
jgi:hypothetical protein